MNIKARTKSFVQDHRTDIIAAVVLTAGFAAIIYGAKVTGDALVEAIEANSDSSEL